MKHSAKRRRSSSSPAYSERRNASTWPVMRSMPDEERSSIIVLTAEKVAEGSSIATMRPSSRPSGVISPAVEQPACGSAGARSFNAAASVAGSTRLCEKKMRANAASMAAASAAIASAKASTSGSSPVSTVRPHA